MTGSTAGGGAGPHRGRPSVDETRDPWTRHSSRAVYENAWIEVREDAVLDPAGRPGVYGVTSPRNLALGVLPVFDDGTVVLVGQYRYPLGQYSWEIPEGGGAKDVPPLESIARELREETGLVAAAWHPLLTLHLSNSISDELAHCWAAWDLTITEAEPESTEELALWRLPFDDAVDLVWEGVITDAMSVAVIAKVEAMRQRDELPQPLAARLAPPHEGGFPR